ncbi:unnamed protein product [Ostreobium quekettii]|uniref:BACK domain-containing protein n=1 Tax=Ostreobium quekettii TaxID=121088 RepID=A0A8S1J7Z2_9CHLO|nr:unnamed protein product [Ostreobium quekettii]|eukprot:evm.model.scf_160EXC.6 EVM.evm.TU.scf_160EXC.6   scf_160EXC:87845-88861(-)
MVDKLVDPCVTSLISSDRKWEDDMKLLGMLEGSRIKARPSVVSLIEVIGCVLLMKFPDLEEVGLDDNARDNFCQLPLPAVKLLLRHAGLKVAAKETVFWVVNEWMDKNFPEGNRSVATSRSGDAALELGGCIKFCLLSPYYLQVVSSAQWMRDVCTWWVKEALHFHTLADFPGDLQQIKERMGDRCVPRPGSSRRSFQIIFNEDAMFVRDALTSSCAREPYIESVVAFRGYTWSLQAFKDGDVAMSVSVFVRGPAMAPYSRIDCLGVERPLPSTDWPKSLDLDVETTAGHVHFEDKVPVGWGIDDAPTFSADIFNCMLEAQGELVVGGRIKMIATVMY